MDDMEMLAIIFDGLLIVAVLGLWIAWIKQNKLQSNIEDKLAEAASQLQEATQMLDQALDQIGRLKISESPKPVDTITKVRIPPKHAETPLSESSNGDNAQLIQILRMQREGESAENIAQHLEIPLARVKLLLMLSSPDTGK